MNGPKDYCIDDRDMQPSHWKWKKVSRPDLTFPGKVTINYFGIRLDFLQ